MGTPLRILLLEDDPYDGELIERQLQKASLDFVLTRVVTEEEFRFEASGGGHDIILADFYLPDFDGLSALRIALEVAPELPFIVVSGSIGEELAIRVLREGAADYVPKDRLARLANAIAAALTRKREQQERRD